jgi:Skp family chaperone for outer membrane proteins
MRMTVNVVAAAAVLFAAVPALAQFQPGAPPITPRSQAQQPAPAAAPPSGGTTQALPVPVIAIVDLDRIMQESVAYQKAAAQIDKLRQQTSDELRQRENQLRDAEQELSRQQRIVTAEQFDQKRRDFQRQVGEAQQFAQTKKRDLDNVSNGAMNQIRNTIVQVVGEIARERGINMVLPRAAVVLESPAFDVSNEVITRVNQKLPSVTVAATATPKPAPQKPAAQGQAPKK